MRKVTGFQKIFKEPLKTMKSLSVAVCVDERGGMTFFGKRQSRDRVLIQELLDSTKGKVYIRKFSSLLFEGHEDRIVVCEDPFSGAGDDDVIFIEDMPLKDKTNEIDRLIVYCWGKVYPSDKKLGFKPEECFRAIESSEFAGSSHDKITKTVYKK